MIVALVGILYFPGLSGDYVFDDIGNIFANSRLHILSLSELWGAASSGDAGPMGRPVSLATFAINYFFSGLAPLPFKVTNLAIHLLNVIAVWQIARLLAPRIAQVSGISNEKFISQGPLLVAMLWGVHPLNLTSVLYIVQRMTSLSTMFGLIAVIFYLRIRLAVGDNVEKRPWYLQTIDLCMMLLALILSALSKESGLLFLPLILWLEYVFFNFEKNGTPIIWLRLRLKSWIVLSLIVGLVVFSFCYLPHAISDQAYSARDFTLKERLLTECRVLWYYLRLFIYPSVSELALYHDDFEISSSLLAPFSTIVSIASLVMVSGLLFLLRKRIQVFWFAWGWFLISHSMESTIFPLELVHEHRNYFSTLGLLMCVPVLIYTMEARIKTLFVATVAALAVLFCFVTWERSMQWSNLVDQALLEAANKPNSERSNYQLGRIYLKLYENSADAKFLAMAERQFHKTLETYRPANGAFFALIHIAYQKKLQPSETLVKELISRLTILPYQNSNVAFVDAFIKCQLSSECAMPDEKAMEIIAAGLENPTAGKTSRVELYKIAAQYLINRTGDFKKGIDLLYEAVSEKDGSPIRIMLAQARRLSGDSIDAAKEIEIAERLDVHGSYAKLIQREKNLLNSSDIDSSIKAQRD